MRTIIKHKPKSIEDFKNRLLIWSQQFDDVVWLDSNHNKGKYGSYDAILAVDALTSIQTDYSNGFEKLKEYQSNVKDWIFGYLTYDLKNDLEWLQSNNHDGLQFPDLYFFQPKKLFFIKGNTVKIKYLNAVHDVLEEDLLAIEKSNVHYVKQEINPVKIKLDTENCMSYYARVIKDIEIKDSPRWMQSRLIASGMRPINNVVDITNYVMLETGQPLHAFDYDLLDSDTISVRMANVDEKLITLDEKERTLLPSDIVITNNKKSVALGGVMGGYDTEIVPTSKRILLESATFDPYHIRITSSRLDLRSEASTRFERKVDPKRSILALEMATSLFIEYAGGKALKGISKVDNIDYSEINIELSLDKINSYLGSDYSLELIIDTLDKLKFDFDVMDNIFNIIAPSRRRDILTYQDIIEEIGRIIGYDKLPLTLPKTISIGKLSERQLFKREIRGMLVGLGLNEVVTYSLINEEEAYDFVKEENPLVKLLMPMSMDKNVLTHTPINGILDSVKYNVARKNKDIMFFVI